MQLLSIIIFIPPDILYFSDGMTYSLMNYGGDIIAG